MTHIAADAEVLRLLVQGVHSKEIASHRKISPRTVKQRTCAPCFCAPKFAKGVSG